jgi:mannose-6-phosphate isomerase-like protein (cupin superfamily)
MSQHPVTVEPVSSQSAEHYVWGDVCDGWHLLKFDDMSVIEELVPPGAGEVRHHHKHARQFFYVLEGQATLEFGGRTVVFSAGQGMHVPPGVEHRFCNNSPSPVRFLVLSSPTTRGDRINAA